MTGGLKPYPAYQDSGVPWLGEVPEHWDVTRTRYLFREVDRRSQAGAETHLSMSQKLGLVPSSDVEQRTLVSETYVGGKLCEPGDLVLNRLKAHLGVFARARQPGVISPDYTVLRPRRHLEVRYFEETLRSPVCRSELRVRAKGIVEGFWRLYIDDFYDIRVPVPPSPEQSAIVRFLDHADWRIRRYIRAKQKLIKLLEEQKQAIIHRAVTRGLDPNVRLKPSGVEWLGEVPEHWDIVPLRRRWTVTDCKHLTVPFVQDEDSIPLASVREVQSFDLSLTKAKRTTQEWYEALIQGDRVPRRGDLIYCRNVSVGAAAFVNTDERLAMGQDVCLIRSKTQNQRYLNYFLHSPAMESQLSALMVGSTFDRINVADIKGLTIPVPPKTEQDAIADELDRSMVGLDRAVLSAQHEIALLREYRTRLIANVVTGKLDVRKAAGGLPDEEKPEEPEEVEGLAEGDDGVGDGDLDAAPEEAEA